MFRDEAFQMYRQTCWWWMIGRSLPWKTPLGRSNIGAIEFTWYEGAQRQSKPYSRFFKLVCLTILHPHNIPINDTLQPTRIETRRWLLFWLQKCGAGSTDNTPFSFQMEDWLLQLSSVDMLPLFFFLHRLFLIAVDLQIWILLPLMCIELWKEASLRRSTGIQHYLPTSTFCYKGFK